MKKTAYFIGGIALYIGMALVFSSYGNILAHRNINKGIIEKFKTRFLESSSSGEFKDYDFLFNSSVGYEGEMITKGGKLYVNEEIKSLSAEEWIVEGGFSADEPQLQASLRHFYDPTEDTTKRYLQDHLGVIMNEESPTFNPRIDHIAWATRELEHTYNWTLGKSKLKIALETSDVKDRNKLMAYAWRSLGETLHMIADMGCPAHVRDDAHPGLFDNYSSLKHFGNSDPYENICEQLTDRMIAWTEGAVDPVLKTKFLKAPTVGQIGHELAVYTNKNFFTDQTISGRKVTPRIHPEKTYPSPKIEDCIYDPVDFTYTKKISGHDVIMCRDKSYAMPHNAYIDRVCVESQAKALMPQIAEAGANAIRLFIPNLEVVIEELTESKIKGSVKHTTDEEYKNEILYNGEIELVNSKSLKMVGVIDCEDGEFDASHGIKSKDIDWDSEGLVARILFGGVTVNSNEKRMGDISGEFSMTIIDFESGEVLDEEAERCARNDYSFSFPSGTPDSYYCSIDFGDGSNIEELDIERLRGLQNSYNHAFNHIYYDPGTYQVVATLMDDKKNMLSEIRQEFVVNRNDFLDKLLPMTDVEIDMGWATYYKFEDGSTHWAAFDYAESFSDGPDAVVTWAGRTFNLHKQGDDAEIKISGTLSDDCWSIESLHGIFHIKDSYSSELKIEKLPIIETYMAPCPDEEIESDYSYIYFEPEKFVSSMTARKKNGSDKWVNFTSVDWSQVSLSVKFRK